MSYELKCKAGKFPLESYQGWFDKAQDLIDKKMSGAGNLQAVFQDSLGEKYYAPAEGVAKIAKDVILHGGPLVPLFGHSTIAEDGDVIIRVNPKVRCSFLKDKGQFTINGMVADEEPKAK